MELIFQRSYKKKKKKREDRVRVSILYTIQNLSLYYFTESVFRVSEKKLQIVERVYRKAKNYRVKKKTSFSAALFGFSIEIFRNGFVMRKIRDVDFSEANITSSHDVIGTDTRILYTKRRRELATGKRATKSCTI